MSLTSFWGLWNASDCLKQAIKHCITKCGFAHSQHETEKEESLFGNGYLMSKPDSLKKSMQNLPSWNVGSFLPQHKWKMTFLYPVATCWKCETAIFLVLWLFWKYHTKCSAVEDASSHIVKVTEGFSFDQHFCKL